MAECFQWDYPAYQWRRDAAFSEICLACNEEFRRWFIPHPGGADTNDLIKFVAMRLKMLAKRVSKKETVARCECFNKHGRCRNFGKHEREGRLICQFHDARISKGWSPIFTDRALGNVWQLKVRELLYGDWLDEGSGSVGQAFDEDQVKALMK